MTDVDHVESSSHAAAPSQSCSSSSCSASCSSSFSAQYPATTCNEMSWRCHRKLGLLQTAVERLRDSDKREESVHFATLRSAMGRECLQIFLNLNLSEEDKKKVDKYMEALENYFKPSRNAVYERYVFNTCVQQNEESVTNLRKREKIGRFVRIRRADGWVL